MIMMMMVKMMINDDDMMMMVMVKIMVMVKMIMMMMIIQERQWPHRLRRHRAHGVESHGQGEYLTSELNDYGSKIGVFSRKCSHSF